MEVQVFGSDGRTVAVRLIIIIIIFETEVNQSEFSQSTFKLSPVEEFLVIELSSEIGPSSSYTIKIRYSGDMNNRIVGFYRSVYKQGNSEK